jgi:hypothetical protein
MAVPVVAVAVHVVAQDKPGRLLVAMPSPVAVNVMR